MRKENAASAVMIAMTLAKIGRWMKKRTMGASAWWNYFFAGSVAAAGAVGLAAWSASAAVVAAGLGS